MSNLKVTITIDYDTVKRLQELAEYELERKIKDHIRMLRRDSRYQKDPSEEPSPQHYKHHRVSMLQSAKEGMEKARELLDDLRMARAEMDITSEADNS